MAASKLERFQSIIKRCEGLMKGGVMKKKPLWYDVYVKHPAHLEPTIMRDKPEMEIREIFYEEDISKAQRLNEHLYMEYKPKDKQSRKKFKLVSNQDSKVNENKKSELFDLTD